MSINLNKPKWHEVINNIEAQPPIFNNNKSQVRTIANNCQLSIISTYRLLVLLQKKGIITYEKTGNNKRTKLPLLTEKGTKLKEAIKTINETIR